MTQTLTNTDSWVPMALCRDYLSAQFEAQHVRVREPDGTERDQALNWAVGVPANGDWEALGAWPGATVGCARWRGVWEDLESRGVDKISLVRAANLDARTLCPGTKVLPPIWRILGQGGGPDAADVGVLRAEARRAVREASGVRAARISLERLPVWARAGRAAVLSPDWPAVLEQFRPFYALRPHRRALVCAADEYLESLGLSLRRAVARHGPFADLAAAVSFVAQTISRDELRLKFSNLSKAARPVLSLVRSDVAGVASLGH